MLSKQEEDRNHRGHLRKVYSCVINLKYEIQIKHAYRGGVSTSIILKKHNYMEVIFAAIGGDCLALLLAHLL